MSVLLLVLALPSLGGCAVFTPLSAVLHHYLRREPPLEDGVVFGVLLLRGQLYGADLENKQIEIQQLIKLCDTIMERNRRGWISPHTVRRLSRGLSWLKQGRQFRKMVGAPVGFPPYRLEEGLLSGSPSPGDSTLCILEALDGSSPSRECFLQETDPRARGYTLSHQAIYFLLTSVMKTNPFIVNSILSKLCKKMLSEVEYTRARGMPIELVDLLIEEVAVCGMANFKEFLLETTLDFILKLQEDEGCFSTRRVDPSMDKCDDHLSAVSMVALGNFVYFTRNSTSNNENLNII